MLLKNKIALIYATRAAAACRRRSSRLFQKFLPIGYGCHPTRWRSRDFHRDVLFFAGSRAR